MGSNIKKSFIAKIIANYPLRETGERHNYLIQLKIEETVPTSPGEFFEIHLVGTENSDLNENMPLIGRPLSIGGAKYDQNTTIINLIYKIVGPCTKNLAKLVPGDSVRLAGPLGKGLFKVPDSIKRAFLIAGGVGLPPMLFLSKKLLETNIDEIYLLIGSGVKGELPLPEKLNPEFEHLGDSRINLRIATDDGSEGHRGFVTDLLQQELDKENPEDSIVYTCGPWIMMKKVAQISEEKNLPCQVSLEERMACGIGACQSCVVKMKNSPVPYKLCCKDGPVFNSKEIDWEIH